MSSRRSKTSSQVSPPLRSIPHPAHELTTVLTADIYRIVSNKALEQNENQIKPPGESITVTPSVDGPSQNGKAGCC